MPSFYFHLRGPKGLEWDDTGLEFVGIEAVYLEACRTLPEMSADFAYEGENPARYAFEITDLAGTPLMEVPFTEVLDRGRKPVTPSSPRRLRGAVATMERTADLITSIREERAVLRATLAETRRLLNLSQAVMAQGPLALRPLGPKSVALNLTANPYYQYA